MKQNIAKLVNDLEIAYHKNHSIDDMYLESCRMCGGKGFMEILAGVGYVMQVRNTRIPAEKPTEQEYVEKERIEKKIKDYIAYEEWLCHANNDYCNKCGHGFPG